MTATSLYSRRTLLRRGGSERFAVLAVPLLVNLVILG